MIIDSRDVQKNYQFQYNGRVAVGEGETEIIIKIPEVPGGKTVVFNIDVNGTEMAVDPSQVDVHVVKADEVLKVVKK